MEEAMTTNELQQQIIELNQKVDLLLEYVHEQRMKREVVDDLIADVTIVTKDAFKSVVQELDDQGCELDTEALKHLAFRMLRNTNNFNHAIELFESTVDLVKDAGPIVNEVIIDFINKLHEFESKGYFEYVNELYNMLGEMHKHYSVQDLKNLSSNMGSLFNIMKMMTDGQFLTSLEKSTKALSTVKMDDNLDNKSFYKLYKELKTPEVRKALSYTLRVIKEVSKANQQ